MEGYVIIKPKGELDLSNAFNFKKQLLNDFLTKGKNKLIIDLSDVHYMDSSALGAMISLHKSCRLNGGMLILIKMDKSLKRLFKLTQLDSIIPIYESLDEFLKNTGG
ncbi:MAG TPA: anti-sigma factor antagonist [Thermotoga sp.]|nr:MAG: anti-sigma factor antagonist [Thermotoga sp.]HDG62291.1 anti-sigma factor antagonist [Thermotoga sp.]